MRWISVKDRLPEEGVEVLTFWEGLNCKYNLDYIVLFSEAPNGYVWACTLYDECNKVTHWMPLPPPPA